MGVVYSLLSFDATASGDALSTKDQTVQAIGKSMLYSLFRTSTYAVIPDGVGGGGVAADAADNCVNTTAADFVASVVAIAITAIASVFTLAIASYADMMLAVQVASVANAVETH